MRSTRCTIICDMHLVLQQVLLLLVLLGIIVWHLPPRVLWYHTVRGTSRYYGTGTCCSYGTGMVRTSIPGTILQVLSYCMIRSNTSTNKFKPHARAIRGPKPFLLSRSISTLITTYYYKKLSQT